MLGLPEQTDKSEIKRAFRERVLRFHPDRNPEDPAANARTKAVIEAYEFLSGEKASEALAGVSISMLLGDEEDWVYATAWGDDSQTLYLGCYSGKLYCVDAQGRVELAYECHDVLTSVTSRGDRLLVETDACLHMLERGTYLTSIPKDKNCQFWWTKSGFMQVGTKTIRLYRYSGEQVCRIEFNKSIYDVVWRDGRLDVTTADSLYSFNLGVGVRFLPS